MKCRDNTYTHTRPIRYRSDTDQIPIRWKPPSNTSVDIIPITFRNNSDQIPITYQSNTYTDKMAQITTKYRYNTDKLPIQYRYNTDWIPIQDVPLPFFRSSHHLFKSTCRDSHCVDPQICSGRVVQDRSRQRHSHWPGGPALLMERMEHTHCGRRFVDASLHVPSTFSPLEHFALSFQNRTVGSLLVK